jgi:biotin carboxyl carrier protein
LAKENVEAPIPGKILNIECKVGGDVQEGDVICYIESMKMENPIVAPVAGKIAEVKITEGQVVETGNLLVIIES